MNNLEHEQEQLVEGPTLNDLRCVGPQQQHFRLTSNNNRNINKACQELSRLTLTATFPAPAAATMTSSTSCSAVVAATSKLMALRRIGKAGIAHPFGDERSVTQAFPSGISEKDADPFLMCDFFSMPEQTGPVGDEDSFPIDWHPHRGFDIASYLKSGTGRHGDSLGNRETYETPGMQWMSVGSGVYHAEGGANERGQLVTGFQIWINVPSHRKMEDPRYGTVPPSDLPTETVSPGVTARVLAGSFLGNGEQNKKGPFQTTQPVQMIDLEFESDPSNNGEMPTVSFDIEDGLDTAMIYVYEGSLELSTPTTKDGNERRPQALITNNIALLDASSNDARGIELSLSSNGSNNNKKACAMLFAGKKLQQPIAWHGPIVMTTQEELVQAFTELRSGDFPPKRVEWDYRRIATKPN